MTSRVIAYIDGFNLYFGIKSKGWRRYYWVNPQLLAQNLLKARQALQFTKYFTARVSHNQQKHKRQTTFLEAIETLPKTKIYYGHYLPKRQECFRCGARWESHEEKMTDVNIAVELVNDAHANRFDTALVVSADSDLTAPIESVLKQYPRKRVVVAFPPNRHSKRLRSVASAPFRVGRKKLQDSQFPDAVAKSDTYTLRRPPSWI